MKNFNLLPGTALIISAIFLNSANSQTLKNSQQITWTAKVCNQELLNTFLKTQTQTPQPITYFCPSVKKSCCSVQQAKKLVQQFNSSKKRILVLYNEAKMFVEKVQKSSLTPYANLVESWNAVDQKASTGVGNPSVALTVEELEAMSHEISDLLSNYSQFLALQFTMISGFACSICNSEHSEHFVLDKNSGKIQEVAVKISQCHRLFDQHMFLFESFQILGKWIRVGNIIDHLKKRPVRFSYDDFIQKGQRFFQTLKNCSQDNSSDDEIQLSLSCGLLCHKLFSFNSVMVPFQLASGIKYASENFGEYFNSEETRPEENSFNDVSYRVSVFENIDNPGNWNPASIVTHPQNGIDFEEQKLDQALRISDIIDAGFFLKVNLICLCAVFLTLL